MQIAEKHMTIEEFETFLETTSDDGMHYELYDGEIIAFPTPEMNHGIAVSLLLNFIWNFIRERNLGRAANRVAYKPTHQSASFYQLDAAYCSYKRFPKEAYSQFIKQAPEICIEVVSPSNSRKEINRKIADYLKGGAQQVWIVYPTARQIYVYTAESTFHIYQNDDVLDGGNTLSGFKLPLAELWEQIF
jgi:Uma2 family endonuclease